MRFGKVGSVVNVEWDYRGLVLLVYNQNKRKIKLWWSIEVRRWHGWKCGGFVRSSISRECAGLEEEFGRGEETFFRAK